MARRRLSDDVPRLPRRSGLRFSFGEVLRILVVASGLIALIVLQRPCARSVSKFVTSFDQKDGGVAPVDAAAGVRLRADMTPAEMEAAIALARAQAGIAPREPAPVDALDAGAPVDAGALPDAGAAVDAR